MSDHTCPTVRVRHPSRGFAIINASDLTPDHELFDAPSPPCDLSGTAKSQPAPASVLGTGYPPAAHSGPVAPVQPAPAPDAAEPAESRAAPANEPRRGNRRR